MVDRRRRTPAKKAEVEPSQARAKKPTPLGTDPALTMTTSKGKPLDLTYWDLWFALVAVKDYGGDLGRLAKRLGEEQSFFLRSEGGRAEAEPPA